MNMIAEKLVHIKDPRTILLPGAGRVVGLRVRRFFHLLHGRVALSFTWIIVLQLVR